MRKVEDELTWDDIGGRLIRNLAKGIYSPEDVIREYVQNARDGYNCMSSCPQNPEIIIRPTEDSLSIHDKGIGMDLTDIKNCKKIAVSVKNDSPELAGFRGIGIWAGLEFCENLIIETTKEGCPKKFVLKIHFSEILRHADDNINIKKLIDPRYEISEEEYESSEHFTYVKLEKVLKDSQFLLCDNELERIISANFPCKIDPNYKFNNELQSILDSFPDYQDFSIKIRSRNRNSEIFRKYSENTSAPEELTIINSNNVELARIWFCCNVETKSLPERELELRGFRLRACNIAVGQTNIYSEDDGSKYYIQTTTIPASVRNRLLWFTGEIHITNPSIRPNTSRSELELTNLSRDLIEEIRRFYLQRDKQAQDKSKFNKFLKNIENAKMLLQNIEGSNIQEGTNEHFQLNTYKSICQEAINTTKGTLTEAKKGLVNLLRSGKFKKANKSTLDKLKKIQTELKPNPQKKGKSLTTKISTTTNKPKNSDQKKNEQTEILNIENEKLLTEILLIIEEELGEGSQEAIDISQKIRQLLSK